MTAVFFNFRQYSDHYRPCSDHYSDHYRHGGLRSAGRGKGNRGVGGGDGSGTSGLFCGYDDTLELKCLCTASGRSSSQSLTGRGNKQ